MEAVRTQPARVPAVSPAFAEPDIQTLSRAVRAVTEIECGPLPVLKQLGESRRSFDFRRSATIFRATAKVARLLDC